MNGKLAKKIRKASEGMSINETDRTPRKNYKKLKANVLARKRTTATPAKLKPQPVTAGTVPSKFKGFRKVPTEPVWNQINGVRLDTIKHISRWVTNTKSVMG